MSSPAAETIPISKAPGRVVIISALGVTQIFAWGTSYYLPAVLAAPIVADTGWSLTWVVGGLSLGLLTAGVVSPWVGRSIARRGGRPVLAVSAGLLATGLLALALAHSLPTFLLAWVVIGLGMGAGLYDPAFATLGRLYGERGRSAITTLTLFGGFASTVCWPLSAFLDAHLGWRGTCLAYAVFQLVAALPIYLFVLPREPQRPVSTARTGDASAIAAPRPGAVRPGLFLLLAATITLASVISTVLSGHLLSVLQAKGFALAAAVSLGALVGPAGDRPGDRDGDRALSSSDLDEARRDLAGYGRNRRALGWRAAHHPRSRALRRRHRPGEHRQGHVAARHLRPRTLPHHHGPHRHAKPHRSSGGAVDRRAPPGSRRRQWGFGDVSCLGQFEFHFGRGPIRDAKVDIVRLWSHGYRTREVA